MKELISTIAAALVDYPEEVKVNVIQGEQTSIYELKVAKNDIGKIIGKEGRTAQSIRTLMQIVGNKQNKRAVLEILD